MILYNAFWTQVGVRSVSLHRQHASSLNRLNVPTGGTGSQRQRSHSGGSQNCIHATNQSGSNPELHTGKFLLLLTNVRSSYTLGESVQVAIKIKL